MIGGNVRIFAVFIMLARLKDCAVAQSNYTNMDDEYGVTWMYFPDGDGNPQIMYLTEPKPLSRNDINEERRRQPVRDQVHFELYTRRNQRQPKRTQLRERRDTLDEFNSFYNAKLPTKILIHGWKSSTKSDTIQNIKNAYLTHSDCNVIAVDWSQLASNNYYAVPARQTKEVGRYTAELVDYLCLERGSTTDDFHIVGHSLGAHTAGFTGAFAKSGKITRITGLDPARPLFEGNTGPEGSLDKTDAKFVDIIHTAAGTLGYLHPLGHCDFYPNNGRASQPGCNNIMQEVLEACSHGRSHHLFAESVNSQRGFVSYPCSSYEAYKQGRCKDAQPIMMGEPIPDGSNGVYYLETSDKKPYAKG